MAVTIRDVAQSLNLSHTTVSRVLNDRDTISIPAVTRERVRTAARQMGYTPNRSARALATGRSHLVALQMYRLSSPYAWLVSQQVQEIVRNDGYEVLVREFGNDDLTVQSSVDGILALDTAHLLRGHGKPLSVPYVLMGAQSPHDLTLDCVGVDLCTSARQATEYLIGQGRRRIAHLTSEDYTQEGDARCDGYRVAMRAAGLATEFVPVAHDLRQHGRDALMAYVAAYGCPGALFCRNDELAVGSLRTLHNLGRRVPEDVAVIGCDGIEEGEYLQPPLSTIITPVYEMCMKAWQFLRQRMDEPQALPQSVLLASTLLLRGSA